MIGSNELDATASVLVYVPDEAIDVALREPSSDLVETVLSASRVMVAVAARSLNMSQSELSMAQFRLLVFLAKEGSLRQSELSQLLAISPSQLTRVCDQLVRRSVVYRAQDLRDRRSNIISLSAQGRELVDVVLSARVSAIEEILAMIPYAERATVLAGFQAFVRAAEGYPTGPMDV